MNRGSPVSSLERVGPVQGETRDESEAVQGGR